MKFFPFSEQKTNCLVHSFVISIITYVVEIGAEVHLRETSLVVQWLRLQAANAGGLGSIPSQETRSHILQLRVCIPQLKILHAASKALGTAK